MVEPRRKRMRARKRIRINLRMSCFRRGFILQSKPTQPAMPTKKRRKNIVPDNLPALTTPEEKCPALYTGNKLAE